MKTYIMLLCITGFIGLAYNSMHYKPVHIKPETVPASFKAPSQSPIKPVVLNKPKMASKYDSSIKSLFVDDYGKRPRIKYDRKKKAYVKIMEARE